MTKMVRSRYTLAYKQKAVRLVQSGQSMATVSRSLGLVEQTALVQTWLTPVAWAA
jgi:transposase